MDEGLAPTPERLSARLIHVEMLFINETTTLRGDFVSKIAKYIVAT